MSKILVTGTAGFIGFHTAKRLIERGDDVVGFDVVNEYYDPAIKEARLAILAEMARKSNAGYSFVRANLADRDAVNRCFTEHAFDRVIHLPPRLACATLWRTHWLTSRATSSPSQTSLRPAVTIKHRT